MVKTKLAPKACAVRNRLPTFIGFDTRSTPIPKYPRRRGGAAALPAVAGNVMAGRA